MNDTYEELSVESIYYDKSFNCRGEFLPQSCLDLSQSITEHGLQFPVTVQPRADVFVPLPLGYAYRLIVGHRRFIAVTQLLQQSTITAHVRRGMNETQARVLNLIENLERKSITLLDEANALHAIYADGVSYEQMARDLSRSGTWCRLRWLLTTLPEEIQQDCAAGRLSSADLTIIFSAKEEERVALAREIRMAGLAGNSGAQRVKKFRCFKSGKGRRQIQMMLSFLMGEGIEPSGYRALTWAAGNITDDELLKEFGEEFVEGEKWVQP